MFPTPNESARLTLTLAQTRTLLGIGTRAMNTLLDSGTLHFIQVGRQRLVPRQSLVHFLADTAFLAQREDVDAQPASSG